MVNIRRWACLGLLFSVGCASGPRVENPVSFRPEVGPIENPVMIAPGEPGPHAYAQVFEKVLDVVDDEFKIAYSNRYDGRIVSEPRIAPGIVQFWEPGSPSSSERLLASLQSIRHRAEIQILAAPQGGYLIEVRVFKELLDSPQPLRAPSAVAVFREAPTVERQFQVVDQTRPDVRWIPQGREIGIEQVILEKLRRCQ